MMLLLTCVILLCALEEAQPWRLGHCAGNHCYALFLEDADFHGAQRSCESSGGALGEFSAEQVARTLDSVQPGFTGEFWVSDATGADPQVCSVSAKTTTTATGEPTLLRVPCSRKTAGFLCQYPLNDPCGSLRASGAEQVTYVTHTGLDVTDSEKFPMGTIATAGKSDAEYPDSVHVCFMGHWTRAPWGCEVMNGGCEHACDAATKGCTCPAGSGLHPNNITCTKDPCAECAHGCQKEGDSVACECPAGYRQAPDGKSCVDVDECKEESPCTGEGETCSNTQGAYACNCMEGFELDDGVCANMTICTSCEHMLCLKTNGVYQCECRKGFRVSPTDPTSCEQHCTERDCNARCIMIPGVKGDMENCFCPEGYIRDARGNESMCTDIDECEQEKPCDHRCENAFGSFRCLCDEGFELHGQYECRPKQKGEDADDGEDVVDGEDMGSGSPSGSYPTPAGAHPSAVPFYIQTGSVLGITVFILLCAGLLYVLGRNMAKRCGRFELASLKGPDIFYLQQLSTDTYKRLSFDKQAKNDSQRV